MMKNILNFASFKQKHSINNASSVVQHIEQAKSWVQTQQPEQEEIPFFEFNRKNEQPTPELASVSNGVEYYSRLRIKSDQTAQHLIICGKMADVCLALEKMELAEGNSSI